MDKEDVVFSPVSEEYLATDFPGHIFAGMFCIIYSLWESTKSILKHLLKKKKYTYGFGSKTLFYRLEILQGIVILSLAATGIIVSLTLSGGHHLPLYEENHWNKLKDWHHVTVYLFIGMIGVAHILCFTISSVPVSLIKLMVSTAFFVETFIFHNHTHSRVLLDIFMHQLVGLISFLNGLVAFIDFLIQDNVLLELLRSSFTLLQGSWFFQIAYVLFPPKGSPIWDLMDYENSRFLTVCFCWHFALTYIIIGANYAFISWLIKFRSKKPCSSEVGLLKNTEHEQELEEM
ncbi:transmembrane protein 45A-like [Octodon degus]|uniref:Transmembrane protein 45A-like n=1 Tax=Octodon degus TaxID=10160 RepID=A0A6P3F1E7_OCTDE|nr:transmembrane protein 45A-like [Octodon degus]